MNPSQSLHTIESWGFQYDDSIEPTDFMLTYVDQFPNVQNFLLVGNGLPQISWIVYHLLLKEKITKMFKLYSLYEFCSLETLYDVDGIAIMELGIAKVYGRESMLLHHNLFSIIAKKIPLLISVSDKGAFDSNVPESLISVMKGKVKVIEVGSG